MLACLTRGIRDTGRETANDVGVKAPGDDALLAELWRRLEPLVLDLVREEVDKREARDEYMTTAEAATVAKVKASTIRTWVQLHKLKEHRVGRGLRISRADLEVFLVPGARRRTKRENADDWAQREGKRALVDRPGTRGNRS